jgi:hypothetical protein
MAYVGRQDQDPQMAAEIKNVLIGLLKSLDGLNPDVRVNAAVYLAAVLLGTSDVTREQAQEVFMGLFDAVTNGQAKRSN